MLLGLLVAVSYEIVELLHPGSFRIAAQRARRPLPQLSYFSFTTLATLGPRGHPPHKSARPFSGGARSAGGSALSGILIARW